ncbi:MAG: PEP-CTERM sorting domain-containing protein [Puniceicoccaceae bacterium]|nr:MAG: PEP-CTERM sorting domain-containing protein [Puniceicoccaceae bacterium]
MKLTNKITTIALASALGLAGAVHGQAFDFNIDFSTSAPNQTISFSTATPNVTISQVELSAGSITYNSFGSTFDGTPFAEGSGGWMETTDPLAAKNFFFTITADAGFTFSLTDISSLVRSTNAGPSDMALIVGGDLIDTVATPNEATPILSVVGSSLTDYSNLTSLTIRIAGYDGGSREPTGNGAARIGAIEGTLNVVPEPGAYALLAGLLGLGFVLTRRRRA